MAARDDLRRRRTRAVIGFVIVWAVITGVGIGLLNALPVPPGPTSDQSVGQSQLIRLLAEMAWPIMVGVLSTLVFTIFINRRAPAIIEPTAAQLRGNSRIQTTWIALTLALVIGLAILGTIGLANDSRVGVPDPETHKPPLEVQVIGQQWQFTYRYPSFGGFETAQLVLPADREIEFHVTSLDVVHSFWFYAAGIKLDAVPGVDNVIDMEPLQTGTYRITCAELCGIWHAGMAQDNAEVLNEAKFQQWTAQQQALDAPVMKYLPPYSHTYVPNPPAYGH